MIDIYLVIFNYIIHDVKIFDFSTLFDGMTEQVFAAGRDLTPASGSYRIFAILTTKYCSRVLKAHHTTSTGG